MPFIPSTCKKTKSTKFEYRCKCGPKTGLEGLTEARGYRGALHIIFWNIISIMYNLLDRSPACLIILRQFIGVFNHITTT